MSDDLVKRLLCYADLEDAVYHPWVYKEAADRIAQLEAALEKIAQHDMQAIAMDALRPNERIRKALDAK